MGGGLCLLLSTVDAVPVGHFVTPVLITMKNALYGTINALVVNIQTAKLCMCPSYKNRERGRDRGNGGFDGTGDGG